MIRIVLVVAGIMLLAGPARSLEPRMMKDLPLSRNDVGDLLLLSHHRGFRLGKGLGDVGPFLGSALTGLQFDYLVSRLNYTLSIATQHLLNIIGRKTKLHM